MASFPRTRESILILRDANMDSRVRGNDEQKNGRSFFSTAALHSCRFKAKSFRLPLAGELLSLCVAKEKVTKEKGHPAYALSGHPARKVRVRITGFVDRASCPDAKLAGAPAGHPAGFPPSARRFRGAPVEQRAIVARTFQKSQVNGKSNNRATLCFGFGFGFGSGFCFYASSPSAGQEGPLLYPGPCAAVSRGRQAAQRESTGRSTPFRQGRKPCRKARPRLTDLPGRMPGKRQAGWPSLLVTFLLATQEKSDSVAEGDRPLFTLNASNAPRTTFAVPAGNHAAGALA
jgi:hypothetical protein